MATTVTRSNYWMLKLTSSTTPVFNFKFVVDIFVDGAKLVRLKQPKNNNDSAHINFEKIVKNYIKVTNKHDNTITGSVYNNQYDSIHLMPINRTDYGDYPLSKNTDTLKTFTFKFFEEYSSTADGTVSVSSSSASDVIYPLINFANEWEDKMEFDEDKFSLKPKIVGLMSDPSFQNGTADWLVTGGTCTITHSSGNMIVTANAGTNQSKINTASGIQIYEGKEYILRYNIASTTSVTHWRYWNGREYIDAPYTAGSHVIRFTAKRNYTFYINVYGESNAVDYAYIYLHEDKEESSFLTDLPAYTTKGNDTNGLTPHLTSFNDYKTFSFINTDEGDFDTKDGIIEYKFFSEAPVFEQVTGGGRVCQVPTNYIARIDVDNDSANGSELPSASDSDNERLVFAGVGCGNVKNLYYADKGGYRLDEKNATQMGVKYYTVTYSSGSRVYNGVKTVDKIKRGDRCYIRAVGNTNWTSFGAITGTFGEVFYSNSSNVTGTGEVEIWYGTPSSKTYLFEIASDLNCNSTRFDEYSLAWKNKYGTWDYYMFDGEHSDVRNYNRQDQSQKVAGSWGASDFAIESYERGKVQKVGGTKQTTINTRFITDDYNDYFNGLLMSNEVLLLPKIKSDYSNVYDAAIPVNIKDTSLAYKTNLKDKLVQYSFTFEYAHDLKQRV